MLRSLYSGISGLRNHQTRLDVIGNNIANVNTAGFKASRVIFQDIFSQNISAGMGNQEDRGGTNPMQIGLGIRLSNVDIVHTRAAPQRTDQATDMMINGDGFFIVAQIGDDGRFEPFYTRAGNFGIDDEGYLVNSQGLFVMGYNYNLVMGVIDPGGDQVEGVRERLGQTIESTTRPLTNVVATNILTPGMLRVGDQIPNGSFPNQPDNANGHHTINANDLINLENGLHQWLGEPVANDFTLPQRLGRGVDRDIWRVGDQIPNGTFVGQPAHPDGFTTITNLSHLSAWGWLDQPLVQDLTLDDIQRVNFQPRRDPIFGLVPGEMQPGENGLSRVRVTANRMILPPVDPATGVPTGAPVRGFNDDGTPILNETDEAYSSRLLMWLNEGNFPLEEVGLPGFAVADNGDMSVIMGNRKIVIGRIGLAMFSNVTGLETAGNSLYRESASSGNAIITEAFSDGAGRIDGGALEMSNVDLANEFTDMIVTQRGFQANSRIITVSDTMLEELVNLKR